jgi:hypothetical protein
MTLDFELLKGGSLRILHNAGERVVVISDAAFPPGSTLEFQPGVHAAERLSEALRSIVLRIKVRSCQKHPETGGFRIEGRFVNLSRSAREALLPSS